MGYLTVDIRGRVFIGNNWTSLPLISYFDKSLSIRCKQYKYQNVLLILTLNNDFELFAFFQSLSGAHCAISYVRIHPWKSTQILLTVRVDADGIRGAHFLKRNSLELYLRLSNKAGLEILCGYLVRREHEKHKIATLRHYIASQHAPRWYMHLWIGLIVLQLLFIYMYSNLGTWLIILFIKELIS